MMKDEIIEVCSVFEQPWWLDLVANGKWDVFESRNKNGEIIARFPYAQKKLYGIPYIGIPELTQQLGPWFRFEKNMKRTGKLKLIKEETEKFIAFLAQFSSVDLRFHSSLTYMLPFIWHGYNVKPCYSYRIENLKDEKLIFSNMDAKVRNIIKSAQKKLLIVNDVSSDDLFCLLNYTFRKQNRKFPIPKDTIQKIYSIAYKHNSGKALGVVEKGSGKLISTIFLLYDNHCCYYLLSGTNYNAYIQGAQEFLIWEGIKYAAKVSSYFDFEGSMIPGIESFFRGFGGEAKIYFRISKGSKPFNFLLWIKPKVKKLLKYK